MKKKIGLAIVTYTINYGTFLQAFATQTAIKNLGYDTEILNINSVIKDVSRSRKKYFLSQLFNFAEIRSYSHTISAIIARRINKKYRYYILNREKCFAAFHDKFFEIGKKCASWQGLSEYCKQFSSIIVGSDQLWRPANIAGNFYTLNFVPEYINKISYATSFGLNSVRKNQKEAVTNFLNRIQHLSTREESGADIIKSLTGREAKVVCDPTFLLTKEEWEQYMSSTPIIQGNYIFVYLLSDNKEQREYIKNLSKETSLKIVGVLHGAGFIKGDEQFVNEIPRDIGPLEFLNLIKYAHFVCTDSFHGCVFATIFQKDYYAFKRFRETDRMSTNTRVVHLLERLGLQKRLVENYNKIWFEPINYQRVIKKVEDFRKESVKYLLDSLE